MMKHRILIQTNATTVKTGLAENARELLKYLYRSGKYEIAHYCSQVSEADPSLNTTPWKSYGALPANPMLMQQLAHDPGRQRDAAYGSLNIDKVIKEFKPTILLMSDDIWAFPGHAYRDKAWAKQVAMVYHITIDSLPVLNEAIEQAKSTPYYVTWAKFAQKEMHRLGQKHVKQIYGGSDISKFKPLPPQDKALYRRRFGIDKDTTVFFYLFRNQLRKRAPAILSAFKELKQKDPTVKAKLHFHTSFSETGAGWDFPRLINYFGIDPNDILCTYVCKKCGEWHVGPYKGEDIDCPFCHEKKSCITPSIIHGVSNEDMYKVYGISDAAISPITSGGMEYTCCASLLCGLPLAVTDYSSGEDFAAQPFVRAINWNVDFEPGTSFIKASNSPASIASFMRSIIDMKPAKREKLAQEGREWAVNTFSTEAIGKQWEELFDSIPIKEYKDVELSYKVKNVGFPMPPDSLSDVEFITQLYQNILFLPEPENGEGHLHWQNKLKTGLTRKQVYECFRHIASEDNAKNGPPTDFGSLLDKTGRKRALFVIKQSLGDCLLCTQLFESFHQQYPNHDLYVGTEPKFHEVFKGNPHIYKVLPYNEGMEQEMLMIGAGQNDGAAYFDVYMHPAIQAQRQLNYLSINNIGQSLETA